MVDTCYFTEPHLTEMEDDWPIYAPSPDMIPILDRETNEDLPHISSIFDELEDLLSYSYPDQPNVLAASMSAADLAEFGIRASTIYPSQNNGRSSAAAWRRHARSSTCTLPSQLSWEVEEVHSMPPSTSAGCAMGRDSLTLGRFAVTPCMPMETEYDNWRVGRVQSKRSYRSGSSSRSSQSSGKSLRLRRKVSGQIGRLFKKVFS